nr:ATP-binding cassette domain-containing protein [Angustibacter aerolatus]
MTVLLAEHRLERVLQHADRLVHVGADGRVRDGDPAVLARDADVAPPVVHLGRWAGWQPLPLSVRDARRAAGPLRSALDDAPPAPRRAAPTTEPVLAADAVVVRHGDVTAVAGVDLALRDGEVTALMGRNGAGKSSLLWALQGSGRRTGGRVQVSGDDPARLGAARRRALVGLVPQQPSDLLYLDTVAAEPRPGRPRRRPPIGHGRRAAAAGARGRRPGGAPPRPVRGPAAVPRARGAG